MVKVSSVPKHHAIKTHGESVLKLHTLFILASVYVNNQLQVMGTLTLEMPA
jgi:hypothetical protein